MTDEDVRGKAVLEVGARNVNGSLRSFVEGLAPSQYIGVDLESGPGVDEVGRAEGLPMRFGDAAFDLLISTELVEHVRDWQRVFSNFKSLLRPNGVLLLTTRSLGFPYHGYPHDYWRYEIADMREILSDFQIEALVPDPSEPGVLVKARKPIVYTARALSGVRLHSMVAGRRVPKLRASDVLAFRFANFRKGWRAGKRPPLITRYWQAPLARVRHALPGQWRSAQLPFGCIDIPQPGQAANGEVGTAGWALCNDRIVEISVYLDRKLATVAGPHHSRPDVKMSFPQYSFAEMSGWSAHVTLRGVPAGAHELTVQALTSRGASGCIGSVPLVIEAVSR
ncbi:MAG: class I SAM-dependent methyltransferase [Bryobacteraceae bacterium]